ncbi:MAG: DUF177 domain-containing protein [Rikenellaceae bacterium]
MASNKRYTIAYQELSVGKHLFKFDIDKRFFSMFESSEISDGKCEVSIELEKSNNSLALDVEIIGDVKVVCDRCLDEFLLPMSYDGELIVKVASGVVSGEYEINENEISEDDFNVDVMWQNSDEDTLDLAQYIYESICLGLPFQKVHPADERGILMCNEDMLSRFSASDTEDEY